MNHTIKQVQMWTSIHAPDKLFVTREEAEEFERTSAPRELVAGIIAFEGSINAYDDDAINKIVAKLGEYWGVKGFERPGVAG